MYRDVYLTVRPLLEDEEEASYITAEVLENYSMMTASDIADAEEMSVEDALDTILDSETMPWDVSVACSVAVLLASGVRDLNPPEVDVTGETLYLGSAEYFDSVTNVVPGRWSVLHTSKFTAVICEDVVFDETEGYFDMGEHDATDCYGVFVDPTTAREVFAEFGPFVSPDGLTIRSTLPKFKSAAHRRVDGRCDAIFLSESR